MRWQGGRPRARAAGTSPPTPGSCSASSRKPPLPEFGRVHALHSSRRPGRSPPLGKVAQSKRNGAGNALATGGVLVLPPAAAAAAMPADAARGGASAGDGRGRAGSSGPLQQHAVPERPVRLLQLRRRARRERRAARLLLAVRRASRRGFPAGEQSRPATQRLQLQRVPEVERLAAARLLQGQSGMVLLHGAAGSGKTYTLMVRNRLTAQQHKQQAGIGTGQCRGCWQSSRQRASTPLVVALKQPTIEPTAALDCQFALLAFPTGAAHRVHSCGKRTARPAAAQRRTSSMGRTPHPASNCTHMVALLARASLRLAGPGGARHAAQRGRHLPRGVLHPPAAVGGAPPPVQARRGGLRCAWLSSQAAARAARQQLAPGGPFLPHTKGQRAGRKSSEEGTRDPSSLRWSLS